MTHEVMVLCNCDEIESCRMERYVSDVRLLQAELFKLWWVLVGALQWLRDP